eukprot:jgi/Mesen1/7867/ME000042S07306
MEAGGKTAPEASKRVANTAIGRAQEGGSIEAISSLLLMASSGNGGGEGSSQGVFTKKQCSEIQNMVHSLEELNARPKGGGEPVKVEMPDGRPGSVGGAAGPDDLDSGKSASAALVFAGAPATDSVCENPTPGSPGEAGRLLAEEGSPVTPRASGSDSPQHPANAYLVKSSDAQDVPPAPPAQPYVDPSQADTAAALAAAAMAYANGTSQGYPPAGVEATSAAGSGYGTGLEQAGHGHGGEAYPQPNGQWGWGSGGAGMAQGAYYPSQHPGYQPQDYHMAAGEHYDYSGYYGQHGSGYYGHHAHVAEVDPNVHAHHYYYEAAGGAPAVVPLEQQVHVPPQGEGGQVAQGGEAKEDPEADDSEPEPPGFSSAAAAAAAAHPPAAPSAQPAGTSSASAPATGAGSKPEQAVPVGASDGTSGTPQTSSATGALNPEPSPPGVAGALASTAISNQAYAQSGEAGASHYGVAPYPYSDAYSAYYGGYPPEQQHHGYHAAHGGDQWESMSPQAVPYAGNPGYSYGQVAPPAGGHVAGDASAAWHHAYGSQPAAPYSYYSTSYPEYAGGYVETQQLPSPTPQEENKGGGSSVEAPPPPPPPPPSSEPHAAAAAAPAAPAALSSSHSLSDEQMAPAAEPVKVGMAEPAGLTTSQPEVTLPSERTTPHVTIISTPASQSDAP